MTITLMNGQTVLLDVQCLLMISLVQSKKQVLIEDNNRFKLNKKTMGLISHSFFNALINELDKYTIVNSNLLSYDLQ